MTHKITPRAAKIYKPEILVCPKCNSNLKYCYSVSNKVVQFTSGKYFRIKNLGYKCPKCKDNVYFSQTANKLSFKGYTYSAKIACMIFYYKKRHYSREKICDMLINKNIEISDRNIDEIYNHILDVYNQDYEEIIKKNYQEMLDEFYEIRLSIDLITIENEYFIILYNYFKGNIMAIFDIDSLDDSILNEKLGKYLNNPNIKLIISIRNIGSFLSKIKKLTPSGVQYISYSKF